MHTHTPPPVSQEEPRGVSADSCAAHSRMCVGNRSSFEHTFCVLTVLSDAFKNALLSLTLLVVQRRKEVCLVLRRPRQSLGKISPCYISLKHQQVKRMEAGSSFVLLSRHKSWDPVRVWQKQIKHLAFSHTNMIRVREWMCSWLNLLAEKNIASNVFGEFFRIF